MEEKYCIDTAIWIDFIENRKDPFTNLGECAFKLLSYLLTTKGKIIVSEVLFWELTQHSAIEKIGGLFMLFSKNLEKARVSEKQPEEAEFLAKTRNVPRGDALQAVIARDNNAIMISRDNHFQQLTDICTTIKPEELV